MRTSASKWLTAAGAVAWLAIALRVAGGEDGLKAVDLILRLGDPAKAAEAAKDLSQLEADSLGELIAILEWRENKLAGLLAEAGGRLGFAGRAQVDTEFVVQTATYLIGQFGEEGHTAAPALARLLDHPSPEVRAKAARALRRIGKRAAPELSHMLDSPSDEARLNALKAGGAIGPEAVGLVPKMIPLLFDHSMTVRGEAYFAMARIGREASPAIPVLITAARDARPEVRSQAVRTLAWVGRESEAAEERLEKALGDSDPLVRAEAAMGVSTMRMPPGVAMAKLAKLGLEEDLEVRQAVITSALSYGEEALGPLASLVDEGQPEAAKGALELLGEFGELASPLAGRLAKARTERPALAGEIGALLAKLAALRQAP